MLVAAMEEKDCTLHLARYGGPVAVEELDAVMRRERRFVDGPRRRGREGRWKRDGGHGTGGSKGVEPVSDSASRTRFTAVKPRSGTRSQRPMAAQGAIVPPKPIQAPSAPATRALSLFPSGPSWRRDAPIIGPRTPANSVSSARP